MKASSFKKLYYTLQDNIGKPVTLVTNTLMEDTKNPFKKSRVRTELSKSLKDVKLEKLLNIIAEGDLFYKFTLILDIPPDSEMPCSYVFYCEDKVWKDEKDSRFRIADYPDKEDIFYIEILFKGE